MQRHRHHRDQRRVGQGVQALQVAPQGARAHREHDVVDGRLGRLAHLAHLLHRPRLSREAPGAGDRHVEHRLRRRERQRAALLVDPAVDGARQRGHQPGGLAQHVQGTVQDRGRQVDLRAFTGPAFGQVRRPRRGHVAPVGVGAVGARQQPQRGHAVDQGVVHLEVDRVPAVVEAFDQVDLPERTVPVEQRGVQPRAQRQQFQHPARARQRVAPHVVLEVEGGVGLPRPLAECGDRAPGPLLEQRRHFVGGDRGVEHGADVERVGAVGRLEQLQAADVHRVFSGLGQQEQRVGWRHGQQHQRPSRFGHGRRDGLGRGDCPILRVRGPAWERPAGRPRQEARDAPARGRPRSARRRGPGRRRGRPAGSRGPTP